MTYPYRRLVWNSNLLSGRGGSWAHAVVAACSAPRTWPMFVRPPVRRFFTSQPQYEDVDAYGYAYGGYPGMPLVPVMLGGGGQVGESVANHHNHQRPRYARHGSHNSPEAVRASSRRGWRACHDARCYRSSQMAFMVPSGYPPEHVGAPPLRRAPPPPAPAERERPPLGACRAVLAQTHAQARTCTRPHAHGRGCLPAAEARVPAAAGWAHIGSQT
jgi:hypothetical protein